MPLWSNEDWRARIGSCWCALGRTFNTRFTRCRGKSQRDLSTHQAATMVIMMILFIAANMGLYVTRERHKNLICVIFGETITELHLFRFGLLVTLFVPVLKIFLQVVCAQLPRKLKMSLKQFFIDLNGGLWFIGSVIRTFIVSPVLFVVNFTSICNVLGKIPNHLNKLLNGILMRSLVVVVVVTILLIVSVVVAHTFIFFLLRICGDVERSPGTGNIDYSGVKVFLMELETTAVQASLLLRCGDIESNPGPLPGEGGVNQDVERSIDKVVKSGQINNPDRMFNDLSFVIHDKYMEIGVDLGLGYDYLHNQLETPGVSVTETGNKKAMKMLKLWQQFIDKDHFTYSVLATALEKYGFRDAARNFCYTEASSNLQPKPQQCIETREAPTVSSGNYPPPTVANVAPTVNMSHGYHNYQSPHPASSFMLPPQAHMPMHNQPSLSPHLHNQGVTPIVNVPHGYHNQSPHPSSSFMLPSPGHMPMYNQPFVLPHVYNQGFELTPQAQRFKHDQSQPLLGQVPPCTHDLRHIDRWCKMLVDFYLSQEDSESTDAWPPLKMVDFVTLALVKQDKQNYHLGLQTPQKDVDSVYGEKTNIRYEDIFQTVDKRCLVLLEGRPGSGKTTLMVRLSCDWGRGTFLKSKLVLFVRLRHLSKTGDIYLHDLLRVACPAFTPDDVQGLSSYIEGRLGEDVVFLLDGFDEYASGTSDDNYISKLILKKMYSQSIVILSSRPAATQRFRQRARVWIEVVGFMKEQVYQYINCYFDEKEEKSTPLITHLKKHNNLMNLCYLPLHCAMLVHLYNIDATLPRTETEFYRDFTLSLLIRGVRKHTNMPPNIESFDCLPTSEQLVFHNVCKLAFKATLNSRQVFKERELKDICFNNRSEDNLGLVVVDRYFAKSGTDETYTFLHLTMQEYLAAVCVSRLSESVQIDAIATHFFKQHLFVTSCFLFGILDYSKDITKNLFKRMLVATEDAHLHHIRCAYESQSVSACIDVVNFHKKSLSFERINNSSDIIYITYVLKSGKHDAIELSFSGCNFDVNDAVSLLQGVGDRQLSLTMKQGKAAQSMLNALSHVTVSGLVELAVAYEISFNDDYLTMEPNRLQHSTKLQKLDLQGIDISNCGLEEAFKFWPNLVKLKLDNCRCYVTSVAEVLGEGLQHMTEAHHTTDRTLGITLKNCAFNKEAAIGLLQAVGDRRLSLTISHENMDIDAQPLVDALCLVTLPGLIELDVRNVARYPTMGPNNLKHSTNLQKLKLFGLDSGLEKALKHWPNLVELNLGCCKIDATTAVVLVESLQHTSNLQTLKLRGTDISKGLVEGFKHLPNLVELDLGGCHIDASTAVVFGESLQHASKLQTLSLGRNPIGDDGLHALSLPIKNYCKELKELRLGDTELTDRSITCLTEWIKVLSNLEKLNLGFNHFSRGVVKQIEEAVSERNTRSSSVLPHLLLRGVAKLKLDISRQLHVPNH